MSKDAIPNGDDEVTSEKEAFKYRASVFLIAVGIVFALVRSVNSLDIPVRHDAIGTPHTQPVPPALQEELLR